MYTIGEIAHQMNLSVSTLRYYDEEGLLINVKRDSTGRRIFDQKDIDSLILINCLKNSGMKIKEIKNFMDLCLLGNESLKERFDFFQNQEVVIKKEMQKLEATLDMIKYKQWYYETALEHMDEDYVKNIKVESMPDHIRKLYENTHPIN